ncbi:hypothetical protein [Montanilutibacter psychrotolerans]|uniref:Uncharacterized protein n=1 Tax=Montanilutibacter psychrotolerans TaxID=1327343 RepID=A0A3M8SQY0_9GAMM|nr:hypothetical protein [Lysobacter psychrotolerans]RNF83717.1 hypothetical protein EER27_10095 [Lysobacter psychrotolerans]
MNIFTNMLSLHGFNTDASPADHDETSYAEGLGNEVASRHFFASPFSVFGRRVSAPRREATDADPRVAGACCG